MLNENFVIVGTLIFFFASIGYFIDTLKGRVKPNKVSWFLWALAPLIAFAAELQQGVGLQSLLTGVVGFVGLAVFLASLFSKKAFWKITRLDVICGVLSFLGLSLWFITKTGNIAIVFAILSDGLAAIPTISKSYTHPETEGWFLYFSNSLAALITLLTIKTWDFATAGFPMYLLLMSGLIAFLVKSKIGKHISK